MSEDVDAADADKGWPLEGKEFVRLRSLPMSGGDDDGEQQPAVVSGSPSGLEP